VNQIVQFDYGKSGVLAREHPIAVPLGTRSGKGSRPYHIVNVAGLCITANLAVDDRFAVHGKRSCFSPNTVAIVES
jgi:hypothetical protein